MDTLYADIFLAELVLDGILQSGTVRTFLEKKWIVCAREICECSIWWDSACSNIDKTSRDMQKIKTLRNALRDQKRHEKVSRLTDTGYKLEMFSFSLGEKAYPSRLEHLAGMPLSLFGIGEAKLVSAPASVAVVGTRAPTPYGIRAVTDIVRDLSRKQICIVSGLARGIDTRSHQITLQENGKTIAVLGNGLDCVYPRENADLFKEICNNGCVLSELPPGRNPLRQFFPARNRILSALSDAVAIIEAGEKSGTLHTAAFAVTQGKEVFAVPGNIYSGKSRGSLKLIQDGAQLLLSAEDILFHMADISFFREIDRLRHSKKQVEEVNKWENEKTIADLPACQQKMQIVEILEAENKSSESLIDIVGIPFPQLALLLAEMELSGQIREVDGKYTV